MKRNLFGILAVFGLVYVAGGVANAVPGSCCDVNTLTCTPITVPCPQSCWQTYEFCGSGQCGQVYTECLVDSECVFVDNACAAGFCEGSCISAKDTAPRPASAESPVFGLAPASRSVVFWIGLPL